MKKLITGLLLLIGLELAAGALLFTSGPVSPVARNTNAAYFEPSTGNNWFYNGKDGSNQPIWWRPLQFTDTVSMLSTQYYVNHHGGSSYTFTPPLSLSGSVVSIPAATTSVNGYLTSTNWNTFNGKQNALGFTPENVANKATDFSTVDNTLYPTTQAVYDFVGTIPTIYSADGVLAGSRNVYLGNNVLDFSGSVSDLIISDGFAGNPYIKAIAGNIAFMGESGLILGSSGSAPDSVALYYDKGTAFSPYHYNGIAYNAGTWRLTNYLQAPAEYGGDYSASGSWDGNSILSRGYADLRYAPIGGGGGYIFNQTSQQSSSNFNISGTGIAGVKFTVQKTAANSPSFLINDGSGNELARIVSDHNTNYFAGYQAGNSNVATSSSSGEQNTYVGSQAGFTSTTGYNNTGIGTQALYGNTGIYNTAVGYQTLYNNTGTANVGVGVFALQTNTSGSDNIAIGFRALQSSTTASNNVAIGYNVLFANTTGHDNVAIGAFSTLAVNTTGIFNIALGGNALAANITGSSNMAIGANSLLHSTGDGNSSVGNGNLTSLTTGIYNTSVGYNNATITTGSYSILLGAFIDAPSASASGQLNIGNVLYGINLYQTALNSSTPTATGSIGIGLTTPTARLSIATSTTAAAPLNIGDAGTAPSSPNNADLWVATNHLWTRLNGVTYQLDQQSGSTPNALTMNNSGSGDASGTTFNGGTARTISYNTVGASPLAGSSSLTTIGTIGSSPYTTAGIIHNSVTSGAFTSSLIVNADITNTTIDLTTKVTGVLPIANGGTNLSSYTTGDLPYASATNVLSKLAIGSTGNPLTVISGVPAWSNLVLTNPASAATITLVAGSTLQTTGAFTLNLTTTAGSTPTFTVGSGVVPYLGTVNSWAGAQTFSSTTTTTKHISGSSTSAPTIAAGTGAGTGPTVSVSGNDMAGIVNVTTGTSPTGSNAIVGTITFNVTWGSAPKGVVLTPANRNAQALGTALQVVVPANGQTNGVTTTTFVIESGATNLVASTAYIWTYHVIQ